MYGMIFEDIFGSTVMDFGGDTVYVFIALIVLSDEHGYVRMTPAALARRIGKDVENVKKALSNLSEPDPDSNSPDYDGRRIVSLSELTEGVENRGWLVVNKRAYRGIGTRHRRAALTTERSRKFREKNGNKINDETQCNASQRSATQKRHTYTYTNTNQLNTLSGKPDPSPPKNNFKPQAEEILTFLNNQANRAFQPVPANIDLIINRLKEGATPGQCRQVIARKIRDWATDDDMNRYLRPKTLFNRTNFAQYVGELVVEND